MKSFRRHTGGLRFLSMSVVTAICCQCASFVVADQITNHFEASYDLGSATSVDVSGEIGGRLGGSLAKDNTVSVQGQGWYSGQVTVSGENFNLRIDGSASSLCTGTVGLESISKGTCLHHDMFRFVGEGWQQYEYVTFKVKARGFWEHEFSNNDGSVRADLGISAAGQHWEVSYWRATWDPSHDTGERIVSAEVLFTVPISKNILWNDWTIAAQVEAHAINGRIFMHFGDTMSLESILLPDGTTPESHGYQLEFDSGLPSPNLTVPEPSTLVLLGIGAFGLFAWRRRRKAA
jgi:hypothetical protein